MFHYQCDWCGEQIKVPGEPYVEAAIGIVTGERDHLGKRVAETEPTRFFHITPIRTRDEWDRLGIEVRSNDLGDCCYTRALRAIEGGGDFDTPDAGMEWRLMPIPTEPANRVPGRRAGLWKPDEELTTLAPSARTKTSRALHGAGITTLSLLGELEDHELLALPGLGRKLVEAMRSYIAENTPKRQRAVA